MNDATEKMTYQQRCEAFTAEINVVGDKYGIHAMVTSFCFDEEDGVKGRTLVLGCPEHCKMMFQRLASESAKYIRMADDAVKHNQVDQVH